jgi:hypothetical protein
MEEEEEAMEEEEEAMEEVYARASGTMSHDDAVERGAYVQIWLEKRRLNTFVIPKVLSLGNTMAVQIKDIYSTNGEAGYAHQSRLCSHCAGWFEK